MATDAGSVAQSHSPGEEEGARDAAGKQREREREGGGEKEAGLAPGERHREQEGRERAAC